MYTGYLNASRRIRYLQLIIFDETKTTRVQLVMTLLSYNNIKLRINLAIRLLNYHSQGNKVGVIIGCSFQGVEKETIQYRNMVLQAGLIYFNETTK